DLDYERYPDMTTGHPRMGMEELSRVGFPDWFVRAVASHADYLGVPRETAMEKALYAVDELSGFVLACAYVRPTGLEGLTPKAVTVTPEGRDDVGSPNRILREEVGGKVIVRTGRRIPGVVGPVSGVYHPISVVRMAVEDAYGAKQWREGAEGSAEEVAYRTEKVTRSTCRAVAEYSFRVAERMQAKVYGGPKWTVSPVYAGMLKE